MATGITSIARRVSLVGGVGLAVILLGISGAVSVMLTKVAHERVVAWVGDKSQSLVDSMDALDDTSRILVEKSFGAFRQEFGPSFTLDEATGELRDWGPKLNGNFTQVDKFAGTTGGIAAGYVLKGDDFELITTSVQDASGQRQLGAMLGAQHPAAVAARAGKSYAGRSQAGGKTYMSYYQPVNSDAGKVIGMLSVGFDLDAFEAAMSKMANSAKFFETGGIYVLNVGSNPSQAVFAAHPSARGKRVSEVAPDLLKQLADADEDGYVEDISNVLGSNSNDIFGVLRKNEKSGLWVVAQISRGEAMASHWATLVPFWLLLGGATAGLGFGLFWMMRNWVATPLATLNAAVQSIAKGDLSTPVHSDRQDEIGALMRDTEGMRGRLADMIGTVRHSVDSIGTASTEIATGNQDLSQRTEQTASNLQIAASSMEELTSTVKQTADSARTANQLVSSAAAAAAKGGHVVGQVVTTMDEINTSSKKINDIIGVIDGIAFQTNILALNAAVEAARAGEQGRGFAVVASEVRSLAQRSAEAAKEIKTLIGASVERVETGARLVQDAGSSMNDIVSSVQRVADIIGEISVAASEQSDGIGQVNTSVVQLDQMTQQNAALVEESAAAAESLKEQAQRLVEAVAVFRLANHGGGAPAARVSAPSPVVAPARPAAPAKPALSRPPAPPVFSKAPAPAARAPQPTASPPVAAKKATADIAEGDWETF